MCISTMPAFTRRRRQVYSRIRRMDVAGRAACQIADHSSISSRLSANGPVGSKLRTCRISLFRIRDRDDSVGRGSRGPGRRRWASSRPGGALSCHGGQCYRHCGRPDRCRLENRLRPGSPADRAQVWTVSRQAWCHNQGSAPSSPSLATDAFSISLEISGEVGQAPALAPVWIL